MSGRRDRAASELAIEPDLIASRAALEAVVTGGGAARDALLPWQQALLGAGGC